ncbi:SH3 domain-containing protein, partial [Patescibacteria group bacterium]|nr:SH3 domain-containing protein [Patescibacteria group bacterium]
GDYKVYVIKDGAKQWIQTATEFNAAGYKWADVVETTPAIVAGYPDAAIAAAAALYRAAGDYKVYVIKDGAKQWIQTAAEFNAAGYKWADVVETTPAIVAGYPDAAIAVVTVKVVNTSTLRVRASNTTASAISGKVSLNETFTVLEEKSGWYKIKTKTGITGWISGAYAVKQ